MSPFRRLVLCFCLALALGGSRAAAQPAAPAPPPDPLGRETPRGTVLGFITAARDGKLDVAAQYLEPVPRDASATEIAGQLFTILNGRLPPRIDTLSDKPDGSRSNPIAIDREVVGTIPSANGDQPIVLQRATQKNGARVWLFSRDTLAWVPEVYSEVHLRSIDRYLPQSLTYRVGRIRLFQWLILFGMLPLIYRLLGGLNWIIRFVLARTGRGPASSSPPRSYIAGPVRLLLMAFVIYQFVPSIDLPLAERGLWTLVVATLVLIGSIGLMLRAVDWGAAYLQDRSRAQYNESRALVRLLRGVAKGLVIAAAIVVALRYFGLDPTAALAGLGIGGIAVALAAQKTLENVIGGFSIVFDKAIRVGDSLKIGPTIGTVDYVGLRSTRIRTLDRTMVTVPNGQVATAEIESLSARDKFWFKHIVGLTYGTTVEQMRDVSAAFETLLTRHPNVEPATVRVRFIRMGPYSLDVELHAYIVAADWDRFLAIQQELLLRVMEIVAAAGTDFAFPSQTLHLAGDRPPALPPAVTSSRP